MHFRAHREHGLFICANRPVPNCYQLVAWQHARFLSRTAVVDVAHGPKPVGIYLDPAESRANGQSSRDPLFS